MKKRRKIPTKSELLQLQKLYKTDERIGERLGGVPAYLVAYWRRKKNIPKYSLPKFSETEIRNLWERYGDDEKAGLELGISKAAFYNWRRRYGLREKPAFLKLEQLEFDFPGVRPPSHASSLYGKRSVVQKIMARAAGRDRVEVGEEVQIEPDLAISAGESRGVIAEFMKRDAEFVWNPNKIVLTVDCRNGDSDTQESLDLAEVRQFARRQGIKSFYDLREGTCHQLVVEKGLVLPGHKVIGTAGEMASFGCMAAMAAPVDRATMADLWVEGHCRMTVPRTARVILSGRRYRGVHAVDIALSVAGQLETGAVADMVLEYVGSTVSQMSVGERFTLSNLTALTGARAGTCAYDATTRRFLTGRTLTRYQPVLPDKDAEYQQIYQLNIEQIGPQIASGSNPVDIRRVEEAEDLPVSLIVLGPCTTGRFEDLRVAAEILKGRQVHEDCLMAVIPGSRRVYLEALKKGLIRVFAEAGAVMMSPGCGAEVLRRGGLLAPNDRCLTTSYRQFLDGQNGSRVEMYLCSPATAAASALHGVITEPTRYLR